MPKDTAADLRQTLDELRRELARRTAERDEALDQQTASAEVLSVISSSPRRLQPVFDAIVANAVRICAGSAGMLALREGDGFRGAAAHGFGASFTEMLSGLHRPVPGTTLDLIEKDLRTVQMPDLLAVPAYDQIRLLVPEYAKVRTHLAVPMLKENELLGAILIYRDVVRPFDDKQVELVENFAAQAVIAMENARLITETREALDQQTATAEILGVINSSPGDLTPVFDAILEKAHILCGAPQGGMFLREGEDFRAVATRGMPEPFAERLRQGIGPDAPVPKPLVAGERFVHIQDMAEIDHPMARMAVEVGAARSLLAVPLRKGDALFGMIVAGRRELRPYADKEIALLENFAAQAVIAMENARLITETREALEQQTATAEVLSVINSSPGDLAPVFDAILEKAHSLCGVAFGSLQLYNGEHFRAVATHGIVEPLASLLRQPYTMSELGSPGGRLIAGDRFYQVPDLMEAQSSSPNPRGKAAVELAGIRTLLFLPLRKESRLVGLITAGREAVQPFLEKEISLLENFAVQAVIAMENARLVTETREALEQQTATAEVLGVINSSPGDLAPVFDAMLEKATRLCNAPFGQLAIYDGELFRFVAAHGEKAFALNLQREPHPASDGVTWLHILGGEDVVHVPDVRDTDLYRSGHLRTREFVDNGRGRSLLSVALRKDQTLLGVLSIYRQEPQPFTDKQIALLQNFAAQAVIAMENARLLGELRQRTEEIGELNRGLEARVAAQVEELGRVGRLKRFLAPQLAELIISQGDEKILESHRREIVVVFCDLRGYTAFTETAEPEEVLDFLREYHGALGPLVAQFEGTLDQFSGDGIMVFFNDPVPCPNPAERAVKMAMAMREEAGKLIATWHRDGCELGFGVGIAQGYATLGQIGFSERSGYTAIGTVCNLASRLCADAKDGQILISSRVARAVEAVARLEDLGNLELKGLRRPVAAFNVVQSASPTEARPNLTIVASGPGT